MMVIIGIMFLCCLQIASSSADAKSYRIIWDVDESSTISTPPGVIRGDKGLPLTKYNRGNNGRAVNIYGNKGRMPKYHGNTPISGGLPQLGNLDNHLFIYKRDLAALIPEEDYEGYCLIDYEDWRADFNSTGEIYRTKSIELAGGDRAKAKTEYEAAARLFMEATINATRELRPGCRIGWYAYPRNNLPHLHTDSFRRWCARQTNEFESPCHFKGYAPGEGDHQRRLNDEIQWLWEALDVITPSIYVGIPPHQTTYNHTQTYIRETVEEAVRLAQSTATPTEVIPYAWYLVNNYWQVKPVVDGKEVPRQMIGLAETYLQFQYPRELGADGVFVWGAVCGTPTLNRHGPVCPTLKETDQGPVALQNWVDGLLSIILSNLYPSNSTEGLVLKGDEADITLGVTDDVKIARKDAYQLQIDAEHGLRITGALDTPDLYIDGVYLTDYIKTKIAEVMTELKADNLCTKMGVTQGPVSYKVCVDTKDACEVYMKKGDENGVTGIQTCAQYCGAYGMSCVAQYDDNNNCVRGPKYPNCDVVGSTSDHFCHCGPQ